MQLTDLDPTKIKVPEGYKVIIDPDVAEKERRAEELAVLNTRMKDEKEPSDEELISFAKMTHPYYMDLARLNDLK
jgi:hypothetical protein